MPGKKTWLIADGYMSDTKTDKYVSHEAVCVLNLSGCEAEINLTIYFEDEEPMRGFSTKCAPERTNHIRLDKIRNNEGKAIPKEKSYAVLVESNTPIVCQHSRMDVSTSDMTLMTTIAY